MARLTTLWLGPADASLTERRLEVWQLDRPGELDDRDLLTSQILLGSIDQVDVLLPDGARIQVLLTDVRGGETMRPASIIFNTDDDPLSGADQLAVLSVDDESSSSASSLSTGSSASSGSSSSTSSASSASSRTLSSSSPSSQSTSSQSTLSSASSSSTSTLSSSSTPSSASSQSESSQSSSSSSSSSSSTLG